ncbi:hypothetical protein C7450_108132 [Chelatococcus asaccharovorans]|uniref:Uncharacterized protein n=1 Tax=Chelatococcus asaccharovorans TaxID=28210 RepID=A0A2V3UD46_9HYPH|nr:hypothetical protein C7450_108132 [Chelatococcus asaccharovorans]
MPQTAHTASSPNGETASPAALVPYPISAASSRKFRRFRRMAAPRAFCQRFSLVAPPPPFPESPFKGGYQVAKLQAEFARYSH